ncbi:MAG: HAMP domain-containing histidine kinase [Blastocatellia bacterium]|nr:HAMP domain-containing histidine kinase [Blastocatellia bacterium]
MNDESNPQDIGIILDTYQAAEAKMRRAWHLNAVFIPVGRFFAFLVTAIGVYLNNKFILQSDSLTGFLTFLFTISGYCLISGLILYFFFSKVKKINLGDLFFLLDILIIFYAIYLSGGERSLLFPLMIAWVVDQASTSFKRIMGLTLIAISTFFLFDLFLVFVEHRNISIGFELVKIYIIFGVCLFAALSVRFTDKLRSKVSSAIRVARNLILQLKERSEQLEEARARLEALYQREHEVARTLKELNDMKTNFMIVTSHEMRTPLTIIKGYNEALLNQLFGSLTNTQKKSLEACQHAVNRLTLTLDDILEMMKIHAGQLSLKPREFDLQRMLEQIVTELTPFTEKRHQRITLEAETPLLLVADYAKIYLIFLNLAQNAVKFTYDEGSIGIHAQLKNGLIEVCVKDSGIGIDATEQEKIFEKFYTNSDPNYHTSGRFEFSARGTGLGLSIAKTYTEAHGGRIWVESAGRGQGSRFFVQLPQEFQGLDTKETEEV